MVSWPSTPNSCVPDQMANTQKVATVRSGEASISRNLERSVPTDMNSPNPPSSRPMRMPMVRMGATIMITLCATSVQMTASMPPITV
jgi:hypothetical protein